MTTTIGIRELARSSAVLEQYDYVNIEDKKTHQRKGLIVSNQYADEVEQYLKKIIAKKHQQDINDIMQFAGSIEIRDEFKNATPREVNRAKHHKYL